MTVPAAGPATGATSGSGGTEPGTAVFSGVDLDTVLAHYNQVLDVPRDDLQAIVDEAGLLAARRRMTTLRCADVMSRDVKAVEWGTPLQEAWSLMRTHQIKALPVVDRARRVVGIVTLADFMRGASLDVHDDWATRLRHLIRPTPTTHSDKPEVVGQIMSRQVRVASADRRRFAIPSILPTAGQTRRPPAAPAPFLPPVSLVVKKGSSARSRTSCGMPVPVSVTVSDT